MMRLALALSLCFVFWLHLLATGPVGKTFPA